MQFLQTRWISHISNLEHVRFATAHPNTNHIIIKKKNHHTILYAAYVCEPHDFMGTSYCLKSNYRTANSLFTSQ